MPQRTAGIKHARSGSSGRSATMRTQAPLRAGMANHLMPSHNHDRETAVLPPPRVLITAGPTHEPIDAVRFLGNRSSGRLGVALADEAARREWPVTLLLGPTHRTPTDSRIRLRRFQTGGELERLLGEEFEACDVLIMAAAVADYRPKVDPASSGEKIRRKDEPLNLTLEPAPDLLAAVSSRRRDGQVLVGFALEPRKEMTESARAKLERKGIDLVVANPLETMDSEAIEALVMSRSGAEKRTPGAMGKEAFAPWMLDIVEEHLAGARR
jgi:phosphopantothenoylcysteine decarboxylase / phosphopantothenate---cysteine ligase